MVCNGREPFKTLQISSILDNIKTGRVLRHPFNKTHHLTAENARAEMMYKDPTHTFSSFSSKIQVQ